MKKKIVSLLFAHNEEQFIEQYLKSTSKLVDGLVILLDNCTDKTEKIIDSFNSKNIILIHYPNKNGFNETDNRNILLSAVKEWNVDWFFCLDTDELIDEEKFGKLYDDLNFIEQDTIGTPMVHLWDSKKMYRANQPHGVWFKTDRIFRNKKVFEYKGNKAAHVSPVPYNYTNDDTLFTNILIKHFGYITKEKRLAKYNFWKKFDPENKLESLRYEDLFVPNEIKLRSITDIDFSNYNEYLKFCKNYKEY